MRVHHASAVGELDSLFRRQQIATPLVMGNDGPLTSRSGTQHSWLPGASQGAS